MESFRVIKVSKREILSVFLVCIICVNIYTWIRLVETIPSWVLQLDSLEILGGISYVLSFALIESSIIFLIILLLSLIIPRQYFASQFVANGTLIALSLYSMAVVLHSNFDLLISLNKTQFLILSILIIILISVVLVLINRFKKLDTVITSIVDKALVLGFVYFIMDVIGIIFIVLRNL